jgi:hypothetical protein
MASTLELEIDGQLIGEEDTFLWLLEGRGVRKEKLEMKQEQHKTRHYKQNITQQKTLQRERDSKCTLHQQSGDTAGNVTSTRPIMAKAQNINRYTRVCAQLHFNVYTEIGVKLHNEQWYQH